MGAVGPEDFAEPPREFRPRPLWFWNNTAVTETGIDDQILQAREQSGYGGLAILPFGGAFSPTYLSEDYFTRYGDAVSRAKELGMKLCIYDEYGFPSGSAGAINGDGVPRFANAFPNDTIKRLDKYEAAVTGPASYGRTLPAGTLMACVAMNTATFERIDLSPTIAGNQLAWDAPAGNWRVMIFVCVKDGDPNVDYLSPESCDRFIQMTHQAYFDRFGADFGPDKTIDGVFFDETTLYRAGGRMWTEEFNTKFLAKHGFDPALFYPALWYDIGPDTAAARNFLFGFRSELYATGYAARVQEWCRSHGDIPATGHQDQEEIVNPCNVSGDLMKVFREQDVPGIDKIGGGRPTEKFYKVVSSAAYNWDKEEVMSETYGAMGNIGWDTIYNVALDQATKGINDLIPHAVWYNDSSVTFLPELSWRSPIYAAGLPAYNEFMGRVHYMLRGRARHVADIGMLYPIASLQAGNRLDGPLGYYEGGVTVPDADYADVGQLLTDSLCRDFTFIHPDVMDERMTATGARLDLNNEVNREQYQVFVIPGGDVIRWSNLQKIKAFYDQGGKVIATRKLPTRSAEFGHDADVAGVIAEMFPVTTPYPLATASSSWAAGGYGPELGNDSSLSTRWNAADGTSGNQWLQIDFGSPKTFDRTVIREAFNRITSYQIEWWNGSSWTVCASGTSAGSAKTDVFAAVTASKVRLYVNSIASDSVSIWEFEVRDGATGPNLAAAGLPVVNSNANGGRSYFLSTATPAGLLAAVDDALEVPDVEIEGGARVQYIHKVREGRGIYFFANLSGGTVDTWVRLRGDHAPELWDPHTGGITSPPEIQHLTTAGQPVTRVRIQIANNRGLFLVSPLPGEPTSRLEIDVDGDSVELSLAGLVRDHRYYVDRSPDLLQWFTIADIIASGDPDPSSAEGAWTTMSFLMATEDPAAFFRVSPETDN